MRSRSTRCAVWSSTRTTCFRLMRAAWPSVPEPYGIVEITPEREYPLVTEFFDGAVEIGDVQVDDDLIDQGLEIAAALGCRARAPRHQAGEPHGAAGPAAADRLGVRRASSSPWRQAVDSATCCSSSRCGPIRGRSTSVRSLCSQWTRLLSAFAATRGLTMPSQLRRLSAGAGTRPACGVRGAASGAAAADSDSALEHPPGGSDRASAFLAPRVLTGCLGFCAGSGGSSAARRRRAG